MPGKKYISIKRCVTVIEFVVLDVHIISLVYDVMPMSMQQSPRLIQAIG